MAQPPPWRGLLFVAAAGDSWSMKPCEDLQGGLCGDPPPQAAAIVPSMSSTFSERRFFHGKRFR